MQARCSRCCGNVQRAPPTWYWKGKHLAFSRFRRRDLTGKGETTAHDAGRNKFASYSHTLVRQGSRHHSLCLPRCFGRLGLADKTPASMMSPTADSRHSIAPAGLITPGLATALWCGRSQQATIVMPQECARSSCAASKACEVTGWYNAYCHRLMRWHPEVAPTTRRMGGPQATCVQYSEQRLRVQPLDPTNVHTQYDCSVR